VFALRKLLRPLECAREVRCGHIGASEQRACEAVGERSPFEDEILELAWQGHYAVDLSRAGACLALWKSMPCNVDPSAEPGNCVFGATDLALRPAVPPGGSCTYSNECVGGYCSGRPGCPGICVANPAAGAACDNDRCGDDAYCHEGTCRPRGKVGEPCHGHWDVCAGNLWCAGYVEAKSDPQPEPERPGVCARPRGEGVGCAVYEGGVNCRADLFCDWGAADPTCRTRLPGGADCGAADACADGLTCKGLAHRGDHPRGAHAAVVTRGRCVPFADAGGACEPAAYVSGCPSDMLCDDKTRTCRHTGGLGDPCERARIHAGSPRDRPVAALRWCYGDLYCDAATHTCAPHLRLGEACEPPMGDDDEPCWLSRCDHEKRRCTSRCQK
jgi:hypothetical protein